MCDDCNKKMDECDYELREAINAALKNHVNKMTKLVKDTKSAMISKSVMLTTAALSITLAELQYLSEHFDIPFKSIEIAAQIINGKIDVSGVIDDKEALANLIREKIGSNVNIEVMNFDTETSVEDQDQEDITNTDLGDDDLNRMLSMFSKNAIKA
jgi:hypothetical protein